MIEENEFSAFSASFYIPNADVNCSNLHRYLVVLQCNVSSIYDVSGVLHKQAEFQIPA